MCIMTDYYIGSDNITGTEQADMEKIKATLEACGNTCEIGTVTPEQESASYSVDKNKTFIFMVGGVAPATYWSFKCAVEAGRSPHTIFAHAGWTSTDSSRPFYSEEKALAYEFKAEWDSGGFANQSAMDQDAGEAKTVGEYFQKYSQYITFCYSKDGPEQLGEQICQGTCASGNSGGSSSTPAQSTGGGAVKIPDVTFYGLIKQIIGATDGLFIAANNMAYLLSFQDVFKYRDEYNEFIPTIEPSDVLYDTVKKNWSIAGYYNSVEITYSEGVLKYGHDTLIKQYGENTFYYDCPNDDYETAKSKAQALLTAHVRDYSTDIELQIFYNEHITAGSWVKMHKSLTQITGKTRKERQQEELSAKGKKIETKRKGLTITNLSEEIVKKDNVNKKIHHLVDEKGEKIDIETEESDYDLFFVQGYSCRWDEYNSLIMNLHLKYGPDTPEDPINATIGTLSGGGSSSTGGNTGAAGSTGSASIDAAVQSAIAGCKTNLDKAKAIDKAFKDHIIYDYYYNVHHPDLEEAWTSAHLNCADGANVLSAMFAAAGIEATIIHTSGHYIVKVTVDGQTYYTDNAANSGQHTSRPFGEVWGSTSGSEVGKKISA